MLRSVFFEKFLNLFLILWDCGRRLLIWKMILKMFVFFLFVLLKLFLILWSFGLFWFVLKFLKMLSRFLILCVSVFLFFMKFGLLWVGLLSSYFLLWLLSQRLKWRMKWSMRLSKERSLFSRLINLWLVQLIYCVRIRLFFCENNGCKRLRNVNRMVYFLQCK